VGERDRSRSGPARTSPSADRSRAPSGSAYDAALRYLANRPRSVLEIRRHLIKKHFDERESAEAIERLRELGHADDQTFVRYWLEQRGRFRPKGEFALKSELRAKGVDSRLIDQILGESERDETASARAALATRLSRWRALDDAERKTKAQAFLRQRGFSFDVIEEVLASLDE
jgi:regulatory protein